MTLRRWIAVGALAAALAVLAVAVWLGSGKDARPAAHSELASEPESGAAPAAPPAAPQPRAALEEGAADEGEILEGRHNDLDPEFETVEIDGETTSYVHSAGGFRVDFPSRFNTSVPQLTGPILGRFFLVPPSDALYGTMLYAAALEYTPPGGDEFFAEFERLTDEELGAMGEEFLSENQQAQAVRKLNHRGVYGIEVIARDVRQGVVQVTRIFFRADQMVMVSGLVPALYFEDQEALIRSYLDSLRWL